MMARARSPDSIEAEKMYRSGMKLVEIAQKLGVPDGTVRRWKSTQKWEITVKEKSERSEKKKTNVRKKLGAPIGNRNAQGAGAPKQNRNAEKHGFYSKYLPKEVVTIIKDIEEKEPLEILWENIQISYAAILRAQRIMYVSNKEEMIKEVKKISKGDKKNEVEWEFQFSWDRQSTFLTAQSRAMAELRSQIKQYDDMIHANWEYVTEEQKARISKIKAETERLQTENNNENDIVDNWIATAMNEVSKTEKGESE